MRKHKSVIAILLAVMMIFTFMPTMAFAADGESTAPTWSDDYSQITVDGKTYKTVKLWNTFGFVEVKADLSDYNVPPFDADSDAFIASYANFEGAEVQVNDHALKKIYSKNDFEDLFSDGAMNITGLKVYAPSDVKKTTTGADVNSSNNYALADEQLLEHFLGWKVEAKMPAEYDADSFAEQSFTIQPTYSRCNLNEEYYKAMGTIKPVELKIEASTPTVNDAKFYLDSVSKENKKSAGNVYVPYDGAEHKIVMEDMDGLNVTYSVWNYTTGKYEETTNPTVKNYSEKPMRLRAAVTDSKKGKKNYDFVVSVTKATAPVFRFVANADGAREYDVTDGYDLFNYVEMSSENDAYTADAEAWNAYLREAFKITETPNKVNPNKISAVLEKKTGEELTEIEKKYEDLLNNYNGSPRVSRNSSNVRAEITFVPGVDPTDPSLTGEIEFVKSPTVKTYKVKALKKKAKTFTVKAVADNGAAVQYKLINAPAKITINKTTGKITVGKKLAKGTYKIKVKAYTSSNSVVWASETHAITIKVKKK